MRRLLLGLVAAASLAPAATARADCRTHVLSQADVVAAGKAEAAIAVLAAPACARDARAAVLRALAHLRQGAWDQVRQELARVDDPALSGRAAWIGARAVQGGVPEAVLAALEAPEARRRLGPGGLLAAARLHYRAGRAERAVPYVIEAVKAGWRLDGPELLTAFDRPTEALAVMEPWLATGVAGCRPCGTALAKTLAAIGERRRPEAGLHRRDWERAVDLLRKGRGDAPPTDAEADLEAALLRKLGRQDALPALWASVVRARPGDRRSRARLSDGLLNAGRDGQAVSEARLATAGADPPPEAWLALGRALLAVGEREAVDALDLAIHGGLRSASTWTALGEAKEFAGDRVGARAAYEEASRASPSDVKAWYRLAELARRRGDKAAAETAMTAHRRALAARVGGQIRNDRITSTGATLRQALAAADAGRLAEARDLLDRRAPHMQGGVRAFGRLVIAVRAGDEAAMEEAARPFLALVYGP